jgi:hypothetical protein
VEKLNFVDTHIIDKTTGDNRFNWRLPLYGVIVAVPVSIAIALCTTNTAIFLEILMTFLLGLLILGLSILLVNDKKRRPILSMLCTVIVFWGTLTVLVIFDARHGQAIRSGCRWLLWSRDYKAEVLSQSVLANGDFRHIEWESSGWAGIADTDVYLVLDPTDSLAIPAKAHQSGKFNGIPCAVPRVYRLESHWYTVLFYTDWDWNNCG